MIQIQVLECIWLLQPKLVSMEKLYFYIAPGRMQTVVCLFVCLFGCQCICFPITSKTTWLNFNFFVNVACGCGSVLFRQHRNTQTRLSDLLVLLFDYYLVALPLVRDLTPVKTLYCIIRFTQNVYTSVHSTLHVVTSRTSSLTFSSSAIV